MKEIVYKINSMIKKEIVIILLFFLSGLAYSQISKTIYVDENYREINIIDFNKKLKSDLFYSIIAKNDTAIFKKLRFKEYFGKIKKNKKEQLNKFFYNKYKIDSNKVWLIYYTDSLPKLNDRFKKSNLHLIDTLTAEDIIIRNKRYRGKIVKPSDSLRPYTIALKDSFRKVAVHSHLQESWRKKEKEYKNIKNVTLMHFYNFNKGYPKKDIISEKWLKDENHLLRNIFSDGMMQYPIIIIYPNGDFYLNYHYKKLKKILNHKKYLRYKHKWIGYYERIR